MQQLSVVVCKAILAFYNAQHALRLEVPKDLRTREQSRMLEIHPNIVNFPLQLCIDMGRLLNLRKIAANHPHAGTLSSPQEKILFEKLHNQLEEAVTMMESSKQGEGESSKMGFPKAVSMDQEQTTTPNEPTNVEWVPRGSEDTFLRLCTFKVWCDKYEQEEEWSAHKMVNEWLQEAIQLYNHVSYHWDHCAIKKFPLQTFPAIRKTCINSWLADIPERAGSQMKSSKPSTNWITDWCTFPVVERRMQWESYFCSVILQARNIAQLMGKPDVKIHHDELVNEAVPAAHKGSDGGNGDVIASMEEGESTAEEPPRKKARWEDGGDQVGTLMNLVRTVVREELNITDRSLTVHDRNSYQRHHDILREMNGHLNPLKTQLFHLSHNVNHVFNLLERMVPSAGGSK
eukprot:scaffold601_cov170-Ochromonas_danica.AAC.26